MVVLFGGVATVTVVPGSPRVGTGGFVGLVRMGSPGVVGVVGVVRTGAVGTVGVVLGLCSRVGGDGSRVGTVRLTVSRVAGGVAAGRVGLVVEAVWDVKRGTLSHRHAVIMDDTSTWTLDG